MKNLSHDCDYGFNFDISSVFSVYMDLQEIYGRYRRILENGFADPQEGLAEMNGNWMLILLMK